MISHITHQEILQHKLSINCNEITKDINKLLLTKLQNNIGDRCLSNGYIDKDSIKILRRSLGKFDAERLKGDFIYHVEYQCDVILPTEGCVLKGEATLKNKMGISVFIGNKKQIRVVLSKDFHTDNEEYANVNIGDKVVCTVIACDFQAGSKYIECIGQLGDHGDEYNDVDLDSDEDGDDDGDEDDSDDEEGEADDEAEADEDDEDDGSDGVDEEDDEDNGSDGVDEEDDEDDGSDGVDEEEEEDENEKTTKKVKTRTLIEGGAEEGKSFTDDDE
jgi:DNA-directed RNA polymerase subunit E'/Rpb7